MGRVPARPAVNMSFELLCLVVLAYLVFGPRKLPEMARFFAKTMAEIRRAGNEFRYSLEDEIRKIEVEAKAPIKQLEPAPGVAGAVARPDPSAPPALGSAAEAALDEVPAAYANADHADEDQWYESDEDWEQDVEPGELTPAPPAAGGLGSEPPEAAPERVEAEPGEPPAVRTPAASEAEKAPAHGR